MKLGGLGNQIATPHAALMIHNALRMIKGLEWQHDFKDIIQSMLKERVSTTNGMIQTSGAGIWVTKLESGQMLSEEQVIHIATSLQEFGSSFLPDGMWWDIQGLHDCNADVKESSMNAEDDPVSQVSVVTTANLAAEVESVPPTLPMPIFIPIRIELEGGAVTAWALSDVDPASIPALWNGLFQTEIQRIECDPSDEVPDNDISAVVLRPVEVASVLPHVQLLPTLCEG